MVKVTTDIGFHGYSWNNVVELEMGESYFELTIKQAKKLRKELDEAIKAAKKEVL